MKTSLAIVLAVAALTIGTATMAPISSTAVAGGRRMAHPTSGAGRPLCPPKQPQSGTHRGR